MFAVLELEASQTAHGSIYRVRLGCFIHPRMAAILLAWSRWL